jgi:hypothetical protein
MPSLYTTLTHLKERVSGTLDGVRPVMMDLSSVPSKWRHRIDPHQVLGLGGLIEDEEQGLRCPIVGCSAWRHSLARHLETAHGISADELKEALALPRSVGLVSSMSQARLSARAVPSTAYRVGKKRKGQATKRGGRKNRGRRLAMGIRNARQTCAAQLQDRIKRIAKDNGHTPTAREAIMAMGYATFRAAIRVFGSWNQALLSVELPVRRRVAHRLTRQIIVATWAAFHRENNRFPTLREASSGIGSPIVPSATATLRVLRMKHWSSVVRAMELETQARRGLRVA